MHTPKRQHAGFTLVELMVSISILALMLFLINEIFNSTSVAVTTSVQNSKNIATGRLVGEQFSEDAAAMVGPDANGEGGYIVIIQQRQRNVAMLNPRNLSEVTVPQMRIDQVVFIRNAAGLRSITPQDQGRYGSSLLGQDVGGYAKVFYGHGVRTLPNGRRAGNGASYQLGGADAGFDRIGSDWVLCRQALLFNPIDEEAAAFATRPDPSIAAAPGAYMHADSAYYASAVQNVGSYGGPRNLYMGLTDVTVQNYLPTTNPASLTYQLYNPALNAGVRTFNYLNTAYPDANNRLRINTAPSPADTGYQSWAIGQGHAILAPNCSEVVIDFAADLNGNGKIDMQTPGGTPRDDSGAIVWYDALKLGGNIVWQRPSDPQYQPFISINADTKAFIFRVDDAEPFNDWNTTSGSSTWPYLIRIRYRLHDTRGRLTSNDPAALSDGIDNNGNGEIDEQDEDKISGRWYEHIVKVPRPDPA